MALQVVNLITTSIVHGLDIFFQFMQTTGLYPLYLTMAFVLVAVIYLVRPFLVSVSSDTVSDFKSQVSGSDKSTQKSGSRKGSSRNGGSRKGGSRK